MLLVLGDSADSDRYCHRCHSRHSHSHIVTSHSRHSRNDCNGGVMVTCGSATVLQC